MDIARRIIEAEQKLICRTGQIDDHRVYLGRHLVLELEEWAEKSLGPFRHLTERRTDGAVAEFHGMPVFEVAIAHDHFFVA